MADYLPVPAGTHPPNHSPTYRSTALRAPQLPAIRLPASALEYAGPQVGAAHLQPGGADLTAGGKAQGQRILIHGRISDEQNRPVAHSLVEIWQANAAGRYRHDGDQHDAPLDPHFSGAGRVLTNANGEYEFLSIEPGAYPWGNHANAWRPKHVHFSLFGPAWASRLVTQMYFEGDPLLPLDPIFMSVPDAAARQRLVAPFDLSRTQAGFALAWRFDIVLRGPQDTPFESAPHG